MSGSTANQGRPPKVMSSRLMTMKFMQRAAANTPLPPSPSTPASDPSPPSSKRQKTSRSQFFQSPLNQNAQAHAANAAVGVDAPGDDTAAVKAAVASEQARREAALERFGVESGETKWAFSYFDDSASKAKAEGGLRVLGYGEEESDGQEGQINTANEPWRQEQAAGRMKFGAWKREEDDAKKSQSPDDSDDDSDGSEESDIEPSKGPIDPEAAERARKKRNARRKAEKKEREQLARLRRSKDLNLNGLSKESKSQGLSSAIKCYKCGGLGHIASHCRSQER